MPILHIEGIDAEYRDLVAGEEVLYSDLPQKQQKLLRTEIPFTDDEIVDIANKEHNYTALQRLWVEREEKRMDDGVYAMINGILTFIPGSIYGYFNYWTLENGKKPDYRNCTRKIFILKEYLCFKTKVLAVTRGKSRRKGATSEGTYWEWWICGRKEEKIGGMISYSDESVKKIFQMLFMRGFKAMLPCFVREFDTGSESYIRFVKPVDKKKKGVPIKREGLNSYIDYQPTTLNSYDSGRVSYLLGDEWAKWEKVDVNTYWSKVRPTLTIGTKKVGFAYIPTTVNPKKKGGGNYRIFWDAANQNAINPQTGQSYGINTPSRVVRIFDPATEGYEGCIDEFGESVIDDPIEPIMGNDGEWITEGSRTKILREREGLQGERLMEHRRDYPIDVYDMFAFETGVCEFNEERIVARIKHLEEHPVFWRQVRFQENIKKVKNIITGIETEEISVSWMDDPKGNWWLLEEPIRKNAFTYRGSYDVQNAVHYKAGIDNYRNIFAIEGSDGTIVIMKNSNIVDGIETGLYPVCIFVGRPSLIKHFNREVFKVCLYYGCKANFELDAGSWFYEDFLEWEAIRLLEWTPVREAKFNQKQGHIKPGTESASPFQLAKQLEVAKIYFDGDNPFSYNGNTERCSYIPLLKGALEYNHSERTPAHLMVGFMLSLMPIFGIIKKKSSPQPKQLLPTYEIKRYA